MNRWLLNLVCGLCLIGGLTPLGAQDSDGTLYVASTVYTMSDEPLSPGQVWVVDGKIRAVGAKVEVGSASPELVDLGENSVLMPGLVDAYSQSPLVGEGTNEITSEVTPSFRTLDGVDWDRSALKRQRALGTTTMCVCPGTQNVFSGVASIIKTLNQGDAVLVQDGALLASLCSDPSSRNVARARPDSIYVRQPTNRMGVVWILRKTFQKASEGEGTPDWNPIRESLAGERPLMVVSRVANDIHTVATLADEFEFSPIIVGGQESYRVTDLLAERKYPVILQNIGTDRIRGPERSEVNWNQAGILAEAGVPFALSGDDLLEQARFAVRHGLDRKTALAAITRQPAEILNIADRVGSIAVGQDADLLALNGDPLEITTSIRWVMVNGNTIEINKEN